MSITKIIQTIIQITWNLFVSFCLNQLVETEWPICVRKLMTIGSDNGLSPGQCQTIIWTNPVILLIGPLRINSSEILINIYIYIFIQEKTFKNIACKVCPFVAASIYRALGKSGTAIHSTVYAIKCAHILLAFLVVVVFFCCCIAIEVTLKYIGKFTPILNKIQRAQIVATDLKMRIQG